jgi:hydrogenase maturation factor
VNSDEPTGAAPGEHRLKAGKLPHALLAELLAGLPARERRLLIGPGIGEDAAVLSFGATSLIAKSDPVTFATDLIGWYAVHVNANDIAATGGTPKWFLPTVLLPEGEPESTARRIFSQLAEAAASIGVRLIGGHTEITVGLPRPIISGTMLGEAPPSEIVSTSGACPGDSLILTKGIAIEGLSLFARELGDRLVTAGVSKDTVATAANYLLSPGISVLKDARTAMAAGKVTSMHDPTEGGLATALAEVAEASGTGLEVDEDAVTLLPGCEEICGALGADPWGLISSGALLITCGAEDSGPIVNALQNAGIAASVIGRITGPERGLRIRKRGESGMSPLPSFARDEIARIFE